MVTDVLGQHRAGRHVDALIRGGGEIPRRRRHQGDVDHGVGGVGVEQAQDETATLRRRPVARRTSCWTSTPRTGPCSTLARSGPTQTPPRRPRRGRRRPPRRPWSRAAPAPTDTCPSPGTVNATVRPPAHGPGMAAPGAGADTAVSVPRTVRRPALVSAIVMGVEPWAPVPPAQNHAEDSVPATGVRRAADNALTLGACADAAVRATRWSAIPEPISTATSTAIMRARRRDPVMSEPRARARARHGRGAASGSDAAAPHHCPGPSATPVAASADRPPPPVQPPGPSRQRARHDDPGRGFDGDLDAVGPRSREPTVTVAGRSTVNVAAYPNDLDADVVVPSASVSFQLEAGRHGVEDRSLRDAARDRT